MHPNAPFAILKATIVAVSLKIKRHTYMGFWQNITNFFRGESGKKENSESKTAIAGDYTGFFGYYGSGATAMSVATVYRCVKLLSESVANLPLLYMRL